MKTYDFNWQTFERSFAVAKGLPVKAGTHTEMGRIKKIILKNMNAIYAQQLTIMPTSTDSQVVFQYAILSPSQGNGNGQTIVTLPATSQEITAAIKNDLVALAFSSYGQVISYDYAIVEQLGTELIAKSFSNPSLAVNTSRQPSTTRDTMVNASVDITSTISLTTGQNGKVALQYADNTGFTTNVVTVQSATNGNTGSLTIGLNLSQVYTAALTGIVPAGKYYRLVTTNITGTPTYGTPVIQEVLL